MDALADINFRYLGGIAVEGGRVRYGLLYRSEGPASFLDTHDAALAGLGIRLVCDLRSTYADYQRSTRFGDHSGNRERVKSQLAAIIGSDIDGGILAAVAGIDRGYIEAALDAVTSGYGSFEAYFAAAGVNGLTVSALRRMLVEPCA